MHQSQLLQPTWQIPVVWDLIKTLLIRAGVIQGKKVLPGLVTLENLQPCSLTAEELSAWSENPHLGCSTNYWGELGAGLLVGCARAHLTFCCSHPSPSSSISSAGWVSKGKEEHIYRSSTGVGAHTGVYWEQPRVPLYFPLIFLYCDSHKMSVMIPSGRRTLPRSVCRVPV